MQRAATSCAMRHAPIETSPTDRAKLAAYHAIRLKPGSYHDPYVPGVGRGLPNCEARRDLAMRIMQLSPEQLRMAFTAHDHTGCGRLNANKMQDMLQSLGVSISREKLHIFMQHIAAQRPGGATPQGYITLREFLNNRAAFMTKQPPVSCGTATLFSGATITMQGTPPRKVTTATFSGDDSDQAISKALLEDYSRFIRCPGIAESSWSCFQTFNAAHQDKIPKPPIFDESKDTLCQARKSAPIGYTGYFPVSWFDDQGRRHPPGQRSIQVPTARAKTSHAHHKKSKKKALAEDGADRIKIVPECLPIRVGMAESRTTTNLASFPPLDYRRRSVRCARGKPYLSATKPSIYIG